MLLTVETHSPRGTHELGLSLGRLLKPGNLVALVGSLGAGKTCLAQGILEGLGVREIAVSPTFTLIREYRDERHGGVAAYHLDVYRLESLADMEDLGYEEYFYGEGVTIVEWADKIEGLLPAEYLRVELDMPPGGEEETRILRFLPRGGTYGRLVEELAEHVSTGN